jgi:hypothetical protein
MDLALTAAQTDVVGRARLAASAGEIPAVPPSLTDAVLIGRELGRAAASTAFHAHLLANLLGWRGSGTVAVGLDGPDGLAGCVDFVAHAGGAATLLLPVGAGRIGVFDAGAARLVPQPAIDGPRWQLHFNPEDATEVLESDVDAATVRAGVALAADAVGAAEAALDAAVAHVRSRRQFGAPLGALQAVQHRCADMLIDVTVARDAVFDAAGVADRGEPEASVRVAAAFAKVSAVERCRRVTASAHQLAGGRGIDGEAPYHLWYRRVKAAEPAFGGGRAHRQLIAAALLDGSAT